MTRPAIYLDHNAASPLLPEARAAVGDVLTLVGNPSSVHAHGRALREVIETARSEIARLAGATAKQVVFTGSATEAITQAIVAGSRELKADALAVSTGEHSAVIKAAEASGLPVRNIKLTGEGLIDLDALASVLDQAERADETLLVCVHWVNNETGVVQPMGRISAMVGASRHLLFVDAVQACGKLPLEFAASAPDMMAISGHKIGGIAGVGALLVKGHADTVRLIPGGGQEQGRRGGTEPVAAIAAFGAAAKAFPERYGSNAVAGLADALETGLKALAPDVVIFGERAERIGNTVNFAVPGLKNAVAMMGLDLVGVSISSGSACSSGKVGASHVLKAMGVEAALAEYALRASLGWNSTGEDVAAFLEELEAVLARHRSRRGRAA
jgi:cysteine desulfurase